MTGARSSRGVARPSSCWPCWGPTRPALWLFYCGFVKCGRSHNGAAWAVTQGYQQVYRVPGGIFAWKGAGYPVSAE